MSDFFHAYSQLLTSTKDLVYCQHAVNFPSLCSRLKQVLLIAETNTETSNDELIHKLNSCNQVLADSNIDSLAKTWLPYRYDPKKQRIHWCLPLAEPPRDPFHDQYIDRCRQELSLNHLLQPQTSLAALANWQPVHHIKPAAFIFHLSRCGSTLLSGCLSELKNTHVLSESALLTELLLDAALSKTQRSTLLPKLIQLQANCMQTDGIQNEAKIVIKWNAWDIFNWPLIRALYPDVPVAFLIRNPLEILASHQKLAGRHMAGDQTLKNLHPVFSNSTNNNVLLDFHISVIKKLMQEMQRSTDKHSRFFDYSQLTEAGIISISDFLNLRVTSQEKFRIQARMRFNSKNSQHLFSSDVMQKKQVFNSCEKEHIQRESGVVYRELIVAIQSYS